MRSLPEIVRPWPYLLAGIGFGFLFLAEFGLSTVPLVQAGLVLLAVAGLIGAIRGARALEYWPLFVMAAVLTPLTSDSHVVALPRCGDVAPGVACLAGTRDVLVQFAAEFITFVVSGTGVVLLIARGFARNRERLRR